VTHYERANDDLRVQRTRKLIQDALIDLTIQKGFAAVTVRDITQYAKINRATFYRHYQDKFDLVDQYAQDVYRLLDESDGDSPEAGLVKMFEHIRDHAKFFRVMLGKNGDPAFSEKIRHYIEQRIRRSLPETMQRDKKAAALYLNYVASGSAGVVLWWLEHDMPYSPAELTAFAFRLSAASLTATLAK
jgi:AcrR family transcriptional regulator